MPKILLIEDDPLLIDIYTTKLKEHSFDVQVEDDGARVIEQIKKFNPDLVVLDVDRGMELGAAKYLVKADYTPTQVVVEIQKLLKQ